MKNIIKKNLLTVLLFSSISLAAQTNGRDFTAVDEYVKGLGSLDNMSMGTINNVVSNKFTDKIDKARAIYYWIATSITYDVKSARNNSTQKNTPTDVLASRKAVGIGFASLFQDMCSSAGIRCLTVDGFVKYNTGQINEKGVEINHSWAVVQLGESPDTWFYVDPAFGSGYPDAELKTFTPYYTDAYFFTDKATFNLQHYPDNEAWKLGPAPKSKKDFFELPVMRNASAEYGLKQYIPKDGMLKVKPGKSLNFNYTINGYKEISKVELGIGEKKKYLVKPVDFTYTGGVLHFTYKFDVENSYPVTVIINGQELMSYYVDVQ